MNAFVFTDGQLQLGEGTLLTHTTEDCLRHVVDLSPGDHLVSPGLIIRQKDNRVHGIRPTGGVQFTFECTRDLTGWTMDKRRLFAYDTLGCVHLFDVDKVQPQKLRLARTPTDWAIVPDSRTVVHWNTLGVTASDLHDGRHVALKGHQRPVTAAATTTTVVVTGDQMGAVRIWYIASWKCHHHIRVGDEPIQQICISDKDKIYVRQTSTITGYDLLTAKLFFRINVHNRSMVLTTFGLVVGTNDCLHVYKRADLQFTVATKTQRMVGAVHDRIWSIDQQDPSKASQLALGEPEANWPRECIAWVRRPRWSVDLKHWPLRYLDVLAVAAPQWVPLVDEWNPPHCMFRHQTLREAIVAVVLDKGLDVEKVATHIPPRQLQWWYGKCRAKLAAVTHTDMEFSSNTFDLLLSTYEHITLDDPVIQRWCWFHHGRMCMQPILMYLAENDNSGNYMATIAAAPASPDAILCFTVRGAQMALSHGWLHILIRFMKAFHRHYPHPPTHHMFQMFRAMLTHVRKHLSSDNMDIPMPETGTWKPETRWTPAHVGAYVRVGVRKGFVTRVRLAPGVRTVVWTPLDSDKPKELTEPHAERWHSLPKTGPYTLIEATLELMSVDTWTRQKTTVPWTWFQSETGAYMARGGVVTLLGDTLHIKDATWDDSGGTIVTGDKCTIHSRENVPLEWKAATWSYLDQNAYNLHILQLRACNCVVLSDRNPNIPIRYAVEFLKCCNSATIQHGCTRQCANNITAMTSYAGMLYIGAQCGSISEYETLSTVDDLTRSFERHECSILRLKVAWSKLLSMSEELFVVWCLRTGSCLWSLPAEETFVTFLTFDRNRVCFVESPLTLTLWNLEFQTPLERIPTARMDSNHTFLHFEHPKPGFLLRNTVYFFDDEISCVLPMTHTVTCLIGHDTALYGGTDEGTIFKFQCDNDTFASWSPVKKHSVTCMQRVPKTDLLLIGTSRGFLHVWDSDENTVLFDFPVGTSPIECMHADAMFVLVACKQKLHLLSIVENKAVVSTHMFAAAMNWSPAWRSRIIQDAGKYIEPAVAYCILRDKALSIAMHVLDECTREYQDRSTWCTDEFVDILLSGSLQQSRPILQRLASFRGPRFECVICGDDESSDTVSFIKTCQHRFHTACIHEHIRKTPERHDEMQYEYALSVQLKCPTCRHIFTSGDVAPDIYLNKYLHIPYKSLTSSE